jgi:cytochrome c-type biogenesis protein CcmH/NrfG
MLILRAQAYMKSSEGVRKAIEDLQAVLAEDAGHAQANYLLGMAFIGAGLKKRAAGHFRKALELRPQYREARMELERIGEDDKE